MAEPAHNRSFKRPTLAPHYSRPKTPPNAFIEPLSPSKPTPIEPQFNYPPTNDRLNFTVRPDSPYNASPSRVRSFSTSYNSHHRTPSNSTIDDLANAALGRSPTYTTRRKGSVTFQTNGYNHARPHTHAHYPGSEPPHKRTRSDVLPSPYVAPSASRPATSYEPWAASQSQHAYKSKVEEAALLLHLQSGGTPGSNAALPTPPQAPAARPHSHSFSHVFHSKPDMPPPAPLLPPFRPLEHQQPSPTQAYPQTQYGDALYGTPGTVPTRKDVEMIDARAPPVNQHSQSAPQPVQTQTPPEEIISRDESVDVPMSETSDAPKRRGWPKGKPRGVGARKTLAEKVATKRAATRKKAPQPKSQKGNVAERALSEKPESRRKSLSDAAVFGVRSPSEVRQEALLRAGSVPVDNPMIIREVAAAKPVRKAATLSADTVCAGCDSAKVGVVQGELDEWICCNGCKKWFHFDCAGFKKAHEVRDVDKYFCSVCEPTHGKTTYVRKSNRAHASVDYAELQRGVLKTSEESVEHHYIQPIKDGTFQFDPESFPRMRPEMVTKDFFEKSGTFTEPICIPAEWNPRPWETAKSRTNDEVSHDTGSQEDITSELLAEDLEYEERQDNGQDRLEMIMPEGLTVRHVCNLLGGDWPIDVIDVKTQNSGAKWNLSRWADYYEEKSDSKAIRNVISLEVSQTRLGRILQRPKIVRDIDLQDDVWPVEEFNKGKWPRVQFYCLMSVADSYTDFHIDFGGSSVYYHILKGKKTFFFIPPKPKHLKAYEDWNDSPQQNYTFLPSITKECYRVDLSEGDTMLIPSGWIHAVWTPEDSLVIGGNFLNRLSYRNQFKVVDIEKANETPMKFRYPSFQKIMWYTTIKYLEQDPLPQEVSDLLHQGRRFERELPLWADFDGEIALNDPRTGASNTRYYSQAELDGLPDLVNYIFRTVMIVMGRVEGFSQDRIKRINASIPKGHGEPLELAKRFALWCAWKRGNEDPPAWARPDAVLPNSKEEGPPKKLSERKLKELEKREAMAAWKVAPDRQSARVLKQQGRSQAFGPAAAPDASATSHDPFTSSTSRTSPRHQFHQPQDQYYQMHAPTHQDGPSAMQHSASPSAFMMAGQYFSTPKSSVLGPKRVACDTCRKRRIRCKHKDMVTQADQNSPDGISQQLEGPGSYAGLSNPSLAPELHDNITVTPFRQREDGFAEGQHLQPNVFVNGHPSASNSQTFPGTNAYVNANIPMTMNGVPIFGVEAPKRARTKACYECRKSKRRCIHDDTGNVDPVKAAETPTPRGALPNKKRPSGDSASPAPAQILRAKSTEPTDTPEQPQPPATQAHAFPPPEAKPVIISYNSRPKPPKAHSPRARPPLEMPPQLPPVHQQSPNHIDPNLFSMYTEADQNDYHETQYQSQYPYSATEQQQPYHQQLQPESAYQIPSLEQIANEVLVDLNGDGLPESTQSALETAMQAYHNVSHSPNTNGHPPKPDESVDSAVSLPTTDSLERQELPNGHEAEANDTAAPPLEVLAPQPPPQTNGIRPPSSARSDARPQSSASKSAIDALPLYQPPAPVSVSPEISKRQPVLSNGATHVSPPSDAAPSKRKRDSTSATPSSKKAKVDLQGGAEQAVAEDEDQQSLELAKMLAQQDRGLRRRS